MVDAAHSAAELAAVLARINDDIGYWAERGLAITETGAKVDGSGVMVGVDANVDRAKRELPARYGPGVAFFIEEVKPT